MLYSFLQTHWGFIYSSNNYLLNVSSMDTHIKLCRQEPKNIAVNKKFLLSQSSYYNGELFIVICMFVLSSWKDDKILEERNTYFYVPTEK